MFARLRRGVTGLRLVDVFLKNFMVQKPSIEEHGDSSSKWRTRLLRNEFPDRTFDIKFWQEQGDEAIFAAAWEMVVLAEETKYGRKPRLQRTATALKRLPS
jgi:hypothetical protein